MSGSALVSVVVPTRNSARTLEACLRSIRAQTHGQIELIVVDNHSTDGTASIAHGLADLVLTRGPERCGQRNAGAGEAHGRYLFFVDSDMVLEPDVVAECIETGADAVVVPEVSFGAGFWSRCKALERDCYAGNGSIEAARFVTPSLFVAAGGWDETLVAGDDWDLHARVLACGGCLGRTRSLIRHDEGRLTFGGLLRKKFSYGRSWRRYARKHPALARQQLLRPALLRQWRQLADRPLTLAGMVLMKACEYAAGGVGLVVGCLLPR